MAEAGLARLLEHFRGDASEGSLRCSGGDVSRFRCYRFGLRRAPSFKGRGCPWPAGQRRKLLINREWHGEEGKPRKEPEVNSECGNADDMLQDVNTAAILLHDHGSLAKRRPAGLGKDTAIVQRSSPSMVLASLFPARTAAPPDVSPSFVNSLIANCGPPVIQLASGGHTQALLASWLQHFLRLDISSAYSPGARSGIRVPVRHASQLCSGNHAFYDHEYGTDVV